MNKLCSYRMTSDTGFAPNPFGKYCTLATCMVKLRSSKNITCGSWIIGIGGSNTPVPDRLIYAMRVTKILSIKDYWYDPRFESKKPDQSGSCPEDWVGDNIYHKEGNKWIQEPSLHSNADGTQNEMKTRYDIEKGKNVLISDDFYYFGENALEIPVQFEIMKKKEYRLNCSYPQSFTQDFIKWLMEKKSVINGKPSMLPKKRLFGSNSKFSKCNCSSD